MTTITKVACVRVDADDLANRLQVLNEAGKFPDKQMLLKLLKL